VTAEALISASYLKRQQNDFTECKVIQKEHTAALLSIFCSSNHFLPAELVNQ